MNDHDERATPRPLLAVFLLFALPILIGAAIAPYIFNGLQALSEVTDNLGKLTDAKFERVASRCVMLVAVIILYPVIRMTGLMPQVKAGLKGSPARFRELGWSVALGCASIIVLYGIGYLLGAYSVDLRHTSPGRFLLTFTEYLVGAVFIGLFEEVFFRGFIFGALRSRLGFMIALLLSSAIFSTVHFLRPLYPEPIETANWYTGFAILPYMFERFVWPRDLLFAATLFVMGLTLATFYEKRGSLYLIIGLHGGWVLAMRTGAYLLDRNNSVMPTAFGRGDLISKGYVALLVICAFLASAAWLKKRNPTESS